MNVVLGVGNAGREERGNLLQGLKEGLALRIWKSQKRLRRPKIKRERLCLAMERNKKVKQRDPGNLLQKMALRS